MMRRYQEMFAHPLLSKPSVRFTYGTSGYRAVYGDDLSHCLCRASLVAMLRSSSLAGKWIGLMITASHNPADENGMKIVDYNGDLLDDSWEKIADDIVNSENLAQSVNRIHRRVTQMKEFGDVEVNSNVLIGYDLRESGRTIFGNCSEILEMFDVNVHELARISTPMMHWIVRKTNLTGSLVSVEDYYANITNGILPIYDNTCSESLLDSSNGIVQNVVDGIANYCKEKKKAINFDWVKILNKEGGKLNFHCGADYVKSNAKIPSGFPSDIDGWVASFDGDADRLVFFKANPFDLLDGDRQCALVVKRISELLAHQECEDRSNETCNDLGSLKFGAVLSFYSNSSAKRYVEKICTVNIARIGVKNFLRAAKEFDVCPFFEPNGHGSVYFSNKFRKTIGSCKSAKILSAMATLFDPSAGDAFANFMIFKFMIEKKILFELNPVRDLNIKVRDPVSCDGSYRVTSPSGLQEKIDACLINFKCTGFVRPSGTEALVRIHVEGKEQMVVDDCALGIAQAVYDTCRGIGDHPEISYYTIREKKEKKKKDL